MKQLWRYFTQIKVRDKLPALPGGTAVHFDSTVLDHEIEMVLMLGIARDPIQAQQLMDKHRAATALELYEKMPKRRVNFKARLLAWVRQLEGSQATNPDEVVYQNIKRGMKK